MFQKTGENKKNLKHKYFLSPTLISQTLYGLKKTVNGSMSIPFDVVSIDPFTGTTTFEVSTNSLVAVAAGATAYDQQNKRFFCWSLCWQRRHWAQRHWA